MSKITLIIPSLSAGGAENVMSTIANEFSTRGHVVTLITFDSPLDKDFFYLNENVARARLAIARQSKGFFSAIVNNFQRIYTIRNEVKESRPDVVISFLTETNILSLISLVRTNIPVIVSEHTNPFSCPMPWYWALLRRLTYPWSAQVVTLSPQMTEFFSQSIQLKTSVIANPIMSFDQENLNDQKFKPVSYKTKNKIATLGRLSVEKQQQLLIHAFAQVADEFPDWQLCIVGDGPLKADLEKLSADLNLLKRIEFTGLLQKPWQLLAQDCQIFVLCSSFEGFPMALCEAMAAGLAVISTNYHEGVQDIINSGENGLLTPVGDVDKLAEQIKYLITHPEERNAMAHKARRITKKYGIDEIMSKWTTLVTSVAAND